MTNTKRTPQGNHLLSACGNTHNADLEAEFFLKDPEREPHYPGVISTLPRDVSNSPVTEVRNPAGSGTMQGEQRDGDCRGRRVPSEVPGGTIESPERAESIERRGKRGISIWGAAQQCGGGGGEGERSGGDAGSYFIWGWECSVGSDLLM
ncbi:hypothetical protein DFH07DRAFT_765188 [Mycena maculata]|uniref:Uncharacterized protein n=1 Tax=Mycena maculata TaxID=230809 RepID=A0AAD7NYS2_9AGAR|nr:hypothetical protein DFH07DRAFT_765188 [Mycena maculata]